jgi:hypothetical protein
MIQEACQCCLNATIPQLGITDTPPLYPIKIHLDCWKERILAKSLTTSHHTGGSIDVPKSVDRIHCNQYKSTGGTTVCPPCHPLEFDAQKYFQLRQAPKEHPGAAAVSLQLIMLLWLVSNSQKI